MARLLTTGFELGHAHAEWLFVNSGTPTFDTGTKRTGTRSMKFDAGAGNAPQIVQFDQYSSATGRFYYVRYYLLIPSATGYPTADTQIGSWWTDANVAGVSLSTTGTLYITDSGGAAVGSASGVLTQDQWYRVEQSVKIGTSAGDDAYELRVDGVSISAQTGRTLSNVAPSQFLFGMQDAPGANKVVFFDDVAVNDDTGDDQNAWPGPARIVWLAAASDNNRGAWTGGAGGTTNLFEALNNVPPAGTDTETDTSQIESASATNPNNADFDVATYASAGIGHAAGVILVRAIAIHGEDAAAGVKTGSLLIVSNPVQPSETLFAYGDDVGALGVYPSNWARHASTTLYDPSVVLATAPVVRIGDQTADTAVCSCCMLGITVEYLDGTDQYARPASDVAAGSWSDEDGATTGLALAIGEVVASDSDYAKSSASPAVADILKVALSPAVDPAVSTGHIIRYRYRKDVTGGDRIDLTVRLYQTTTLIASDATLTDIGVAWVTREWTLSGAEADAITDYSALRLWLESVKV